ncbi:GNAT family N-acetyltransferase [Actinoplanes sp. NPDC026670]|uniref:GNAT family N-acetyltransferase n=1 Tax=Actinoplanes sp. NPDC026670 TaxID=3154700 RepID=UPI0033FDD4C9
MELTLRPLTLDDTAAVHEWARLPEVSRYQGWGPNTFEQTEEYVRSSVPAPDGRQVLAIVVDGLVVGNGELRLHGPSTGEIGYAVHPRLWGRGIATTAARRLLELGFREYGRHRIFGTCDPRNEASAAVLRKIGMRYEGRMRGTAHIRDGWRDSDLYAILATD